MTATRISDFRRMVRSSLADWVPDVVREAAAELGGPASRNTVSGDRKQAGLVLSVLQGEPQGLSVSLQRALASLLDAAGAAVARPTPGPSGPALLSLVAEDQIDEEIEIARIIQLIQSEAEDELNRLARLCSGLLNRNAVTADAIPLGPGLCARALRRSLDDFPFDRPARQTLLRVVGTAMGLQLRAVYEAQCQLLVQWDVRPLGYRIERDAHERARAARPSTKNQASRAGGQGSARAVRPTAALERLVVWARQGVEDAPAVAGSAASAAQGEPMFRLRLDALPTEYGPTARILEAGQAVRVMERLFEQIVRQPTLSDSARRQLQRLESPARDLAAREAELWTSLDHPWWQLLDRILAIGSVHGDTEVPAVRDQLDAMQRVVEQLVQAPSLNRAHCAAALVAAERAAATPETSLTLEQREEVVALQAKADHEDVETQLRNQVVRQLRQTPASPGVRQFLVGPWVLAMSVLTLRQGANSLELASMAQVVDEILQAGNAEQPAALPQRHALLRRAHDGLKQAGLPTARIQAEITDLAAALANPERGAPESAADAAPTLPMPDGMLGGHAGLPTVPIDMFETSDMTAAARDRQAWLDSLQPGAYCRIFLTGLWMTAQLSWISNNRNVFVFTSRNDGKLHTMTRRVLEKARGAGLATSIEQGGLLAQAMDTLTDSAPLAL